MDDELASVFGSSDKPRVVGEVDCIGTEPGWLECPRFSIGWHLCGIGRTYVPDVVVSCAGRKFSSITINIKTKYRNVTVLA